MNTTCRFFTFLFASTLAGCAAQSGDEPAASDDAEIQASTPQLSLFEEGSLAYVHQKALPSESGDGWIAFVDEKAVGQSDFLTADFVAVRVEDGKTVRHPLVTWSKGLEGNAAGLKASQSFLAGRKWKGFAMKNAEGKNKIADIAGYEAVVSPGNATAKPVLRITHDDSTFRRDIDISKERDAVVKANPGCSFTPVLDAAFVSQPRNLVVARVDYLTAGAKCPDTHSFVVRHLGK